MSKIGYMPQSNLSLMHKLTVMEHIKLMCDLKGYQGNLEKHIDDILTTFNLAMDFESTIDRLGRFKRRKLALAMAVCGDSDIIFLDEPTHGVKKEKRQLIWALIKQYTKGKTVILATEDAEEA